MGNKRRHWYAKGASLVCEAAGAIGTRNRAIIGRRDEGTIGIRVSIAQSTKLERTALNFRGLCPVVTGFWRSVTVWRQGGLGAVRGRGWAEMATRPLL
jgi:hypothetical protein